MSSLDEIDRHIIDIIQDDGRIKRNELALRVNLSLPAVSERLRRLEEDGIVLGYTALLNYKRLGKDITAFVFVNVDSSKHFQSFVEHAQKLEDVLECHAITGDGTHLLKVRIANAESLEKLLAKIQSWQGVLHTRTNVVLSSPKESTKIKVVDTPIAHSSKSMS
jgi:Lrp/AsnC family transcriptional regulator, leucine-responsive regulatory protein